jgi:prepilin-type N-terminal cleavage/methylation domain-containing protein
MLKIDDLKSGAFHGTWIANNGGDMANDALVPRRPERGFSLVEVLVVVAIVMILAAVALPNIGQYIRNYRIKGAAQEVAGELHAARSKAIMTNTNNGVSFVVLDRDSYRFVQEDMEATEPERLSGMRTLPQGVVFVPSTVGGSAPTLRFLRLGGFCRPSAGSCADSVPEDDRSRADEAALIVDGPHGPYIEMDANGVMEIRLRETATNLERTVRIAPGGRVLPQP